MAAGIQVKRLQNENTKLQQIIDALLREVHDLQHALSNAPKVNNEHR